MNWYTYRDFATIVLYQLGLEYNDRCAEEKTNNSVIIDQEIAKEGAISFIGIFAGLTNTF